MVERLKPALIQILIIITPFLVTLCLCVVGYAVTQMDRKVDSKADKTAVEALCDKVKYKADNDTIIQMIEAMKQKDNYLEQKNLEQDERIDYNRDIMMRQLEVQKSTELIMKSIEAELIKLNK